MQSRSTNDKILAYKKLDDGNRFVLLINKFLNSGKELRD
jgi:hypothetical protein